MFTNCNAVTIYHSEGAVNHIPIFSRHIIQNVYWEETIGSRQNGKEGQQSDSIYVCIPVGSVADFIPSKDDLLFRGIVPDSESIHKIQSLPNKHTITAVADCRYGSAAVQHIEVTAN